MMLDICLFHKKKNSLIMRPNKLFFVLSLLILLVLPTNEVLAIPNLSGRILLQVEERGEAWYVNPLDAKRYYLGLPADAFSLMRSLGLGASDHDIGSFQLSKAPSRLAGRILLQVQDKGQAFYVNPLDLKLYYLGRPNDAFYVMRSLGLGITNNDLAKIPVSSSSAIPPVLKTVVVETPQPKTSDDVNKRFDFKYGNESYYLNLPLSTALFNSYHNSNKTFLYSGQMETESIRNSFYAMFLKFKTGDTAVSSLVTKAKEIALQRNLSEEETLEFVLALIQFIPYDDTKVSSGLNENPFFPYETLYLNRGVCSDKTFLALAVARELGYGAAILDFPDLNHSALGLSCPLEYSLRGSGYCFVETTNYFPLGVTPQNLSNGQAEEDSSFNFTKLFQDSHLGTMEIYLKSSGKEHRGVSLVHTGARAIDDLNKYLKTEIILVNSMEAEAKLKEQEIKEMRAEMDVYLANKEYSKYNDLVKEYNILISAYNNFLISYESKVDNYNAKVVEFNGLTTAFYQK